MPKHTLGSGPIEPRFHKQMNVLARFLDDQFNGEGVTGKDRRVGFVLLVFPFGDGPGHRTNYVSNANREDVVTLLREQLAYFEGMPDNTRGTA
jgi:hypothetical protein